MAGEGTGGELEEGEAVGGESKQDETHQSSKVNLRAQLNDWILQGAASFSLHGWRLEISAVQESYLIIETLQVTLVSTG